MPNTFISPDLITGTALALLRDELVLPRYMTRLGLADFRGREGDTVTIRVPAILTARDYEWRTRTNPIVLDDITEQSIGVTLDKHVYNAIPVTDEELTLDIVDFAEQILVPQTIAVAERIEAIIAAGMAAATLSAAPIVYEEDANSEGTPFYRALVEARRVLNAANVPRQGRVVMIGSDVEAAALKEEDLRRADASGSTQTLREGEIGRLAGFTIVSNNSVAPDFGMAFHPSAFAFANVAPAVPAGASFGRSVTESGIAMRWLRDYDTLYLRDRSVVSSFAGFASVEDARDGSGDLIEENVRAVAIDFTAAGS